MLDETPSPSHRVRDMVARVAAALQHFLRIEAASGIVLFTSAAIAVVWANLAQASYAGTFHTAFGGRLLGHAVLQPLRFWINDGLMTIFFFVVGLEIRRELHDGQLSSPQRAALPVLAAAGGMIAPALIYLGCAGGEATRRGWGVPTATDIAFAVGVLTMLGRRVAPALRVLLLAIAIVDDIGAILIIAFVYSSGIAWAGLAVAAVAIGVCLLLRRLGVRAKIAYALPALGAWLGVLQSGVHPTIIGVLLGFCTPVIAAPGEAESPADQLIRRLHGWVAFAIMPLFALANAGVQLDGVHASGPALRIALGIVLGLVVGKPLGIVAAGLISIRAALARAPEGVGASGLALVGLVAGIGFTMAIFVCQLAFQDAELLSAAKLAILAGSTVAALLALAYGRLSTRAARP